ncbi:MAG TPA: hypothetical protein VGR28_05655 [Candidatus Thermoplasmatota archaeon]|jgi:cytochrome c biogenesis protein CcdA|nr:hypothetical protein [Candidatus Thermoplasmatota archaeon]
MVDTFAVFQAFAAGVLSFFAPCSIAMLPAYISYYLGRGDAPVPDAPAPTRPRLAPALLALAGGALVVAGLVDVALVGSGQSRLGPQQLALVLAGTALVVLAGLRLSPGPAARGARVGLATSLGILAVFALLGVPVYGLLRAIDFATQSLFVLTVAAAMVLMGALGLVGRDLSVILPVRAPKGRGERAFLLFGVGYGLVSMGCNLPLFLLAALGPIVRAADPVSGVAALLAYGAGMALLMIALSVGLALSKEQTERRLRALIPRMKTAGNMVLIAAGLYIAWYDWSVLRLTAVT